MEVLVDKNVMDAENSNYESYEQVTYFSNKLYEAEQHNKIHSKVYTFDEFQRKVKEKYV